MSRKPLYALSAAVSLAVVVSLVVGGEPATQPDHVAQPPNLDKTTLTIGRVLSAMITAPEPTPIGEQLSDEILTRRTTTTSTTEPPPVDEPDPPDERPGTSTTTTLRASSPSTTTATTTSPAEPEPKTGGFESVSEGELAAMINSIRSAEGLAPLARHGALDARARDWARHMGESGSLAHSNIGGLLPAWTSAAENVGVGSSVSEVVTLLQGSASHFSNLVGEFTHQGIGAWRDPDGALWVVHIFTR